MSILSDSNLLLNHIKNSFIYGDDSGICELIIEKDFPNHFNIQDILNDDLKYVIADTSYEKLRSHSPEISFNSQTNNTRKLSSELRVKEVELTESQISVNHTYLDTGDWPRVLNDDEINELFDITEVCKTEISNKSLLSKMLEETNKADIAVFNIFSQYARFSALRYTRSINSITNEPIINQILVCENDFNRPMRDFHIYFWDFEEQRNRSNPIIVRPILETKVSDLIGLACWKYVEENRFPELRNASIVNKMQLYMFEDIEDLDFGFGSLNNNDPIYKYQFCHLAVRESQRNERNKFVSVCSNISSNSFVTRSYMEKMGYQATSLTEIESLTDKNSTSYSSDIGDDSILVEIQLAHGLSKFRFSPSTTVEQIIKHTVNKRHLLQHGENYKYKLELVSEPGKELESHITLSHIDNTNFVLVRDLSRRKPALPDLMSEGDSNALLKTIGAMQPQEYTVYLKQPLKRWEAKISISQELIEIESISGKLPIRMKPKSVTIPIIFLADCTINYHGKNPDNDDNKVTIKLIHLKSKSLLARNMKGALELERGASSLSEKSSLKSHGRQDINVVTNDVTMNNLLSDITSHSISCQASIGKLIYNQINLIINFKNHLIRKEYLTLIN